MNEKQLIYDEIISKYKFNDKQKIEIKLGIESKIDVSVYAKPEFDEFQMFQIYEGLIRGFDVSVYAKPEIKWNEMRKILWAMEDELKAKK